MKPTALIILDGFGFNPSKKHNAIAQADMPYFNQWWHQYPHAILQASGEAVGLPAGYIGNSEVGHLTIGVGKRVAQPVTVINRMIADKALCRNKIIDHDLTTLAQTSGRLHLTGLLSTAGVHSHIDHLEALIDCAIQKGIRNIYVHLFLDGRDMPPKSAVPLLRRISKKLEESGAGAIASLHGRFYAMDRDNNWERTEQSYRVMVGAAKPTSTQPWQELLQNSYEKGVTDEFLKPTLLENGGAIEPGDGVIFFNIRPDRARQLTRAFVDNNFSQFKTMPIEYAFFMSLVPYDHFDKVHIVYEPPMIAHTLKEVLSAYGKTIFSIAETEKYAHVTYFIGGGKEEPFEREIRMLIPSIPAQSYVDSPEMSAQLITDAVIHSLETNPCDFYLINYANADMVGHSGDRAATIKAVEYLDVQLGQLFEHMVTRMNGTLYITADHGNAEMMLDEQTGQPNTAHTTNPVPFLMIQQDLQGCGTTLPLNELSDIAPFILKQLGLPSQNEPE